jgi:NADH dehydrogenase
VDTVITTATATQRGGDDTVPAVDLQGTLSLIEAARAAGVKRFIYTSAYGSVPGHPVPLFNVKGTCEAALEQSGLEYTILWPAVFMEVWIGMVVGVPLMAQQPITLIGQGDHRHNLVSEADVAAFGIAAVDNPRAANQRIGIGGPASYSWTEIVHAVGAAMGASLPVTYLPLGSDVPLLPPEVSSLLNGMETFETFVDMTETAPAYGVELTTLDKYIRRTFVR